ncbi:MAG: GNAT family N-acetyltransferase [Planctomycetes bacterium]|nr:GNAT family N-acetyltransferase [Planctomycetota bacterium]
MWFPDELVAVTKTHGWTARPYTKGDLAEYLKLTLSEHGDSADISNAAYIKWLYEQNPAGQVNMWLAEAGNSLIGSYSTIPVNLVIDGKNLVGSQALNILTHKDYRGKKIFITLAELAYQNGFKDRNIALIYGLPNKMIYRGYPKYLHFTDIGNMPLLIKVNNLGDLLKDRSRFIPSWFFNLVGRCVFRKQRLSYDRKRLKIERILSFDDRFDHLWEANKGLFKNIVVRNKQYLNWRYMNNPARKYTAFSIADLMDNLKGFVVCKTTSVRGIKAGFIGDLFVENNDGQIADILIKKAEEYLCEQGSRILSTLLFKHIHFYNTFLKNNFIKYPAFLGSKSFPVIVRSMDRKQHLISDLKKWHLTMGDFDIF